ncbi:MAG: hypothetical protein KAU12_02795 [Candidatus Omnitrophica bacterium]|nr:hypothetical protein [Candidatus Omnitrophota bacterium]
MSNLKTRQFINLFSILALGLLLSGCVAGFGKKVSVNHNEFRIMSVEELVSEADLIADIKIIANEPVCFRHKSGTYYQMTIIKINQVFKGDLKSKAMTIYARNSNLPYEHIDAYEIYDDMLVFLKKDGNYYFTLNGCGGQMPILDTILVNWRVEEKGKLRERLAIPYKEAKAAIVEILYIQNH